MAEVGWSSQPPPLALGAWGCGIAPPTTGLRLIIFFAAKDGEALYSQQKQDQELAVAHTMNSLLPNSDLN